MKTMSYVSSTRSATESIHLGLASQLRAAAVPRQELTGIDPNQSSFGTTGARSVVETWFVAPTRLDALRTHPWMRPEVGFTKGIRVF